jgi:hypothetical protein
MTEVIVKIMTEVLSILSIATKEIRRSRASELIIGCISGVDVDLSSFRKIHEEARGKN